MKYTQKGSASTVNHFTEKRSVAETLLETISETLSQSGLRPGFSKPGAHRRSRRRQLAGAVAMLAGLAALGFVFLRPASSQLPVGGEPVAFLEIARGKAEIFVDGDRSGTSSFMLAGGEPIHAGAVIETGTATRPASLTGIAPVGHGGDAASGHAAVRLSGGQAMRLDSGSRVRFATNSSVVLERGAVYVDSAGGDNIEVRTALGVVRDIGTRFEVRLLPGPDTAQSLRVRVREGSVELEQDDETHLAVAGEELQMHADGKVERSGSPICGTRWAWVLETPQAPKIAGRPLQDFLNWASKEACWTVHFADEATAKIAAETILHGDVQDLPLTVAASVVLHGSGLDYRLEDGRFIIEPRAEDG